MQRKKNLLFTKRKHPLIAILSTILGTISLLSLFVGIYASYKMRGEIPARFGMACVLATFYAVAGLILALISFQKPDVFRLFGVLGILLNGAALLVSGFILWIPV